MEGNWLKNTLNSLTFFITLLRVNKCDLDNSVGGWTYVSKPGSWGPLGSFQLGAWDYSYLPSAQHLDKSEGDWDT